MSTENLENENQTAADPEQEIVSQGVHNYSAAETYVRPTDPAILQQLEWFQDQKLALMMHFGLYCQPGMVASWALSDKDSDWSRHQVNWADGETFKKQYFNLNRSFNPVRFQPEEWAQMAEDCGFRYLILTTKHHDGFCLWDTKYTDYKTTAEDCPFHEHKNADIVKTMFDAFREKGIGIGAYFSKADWHCPDYWNEELRKDGMTSRGPSYDPKEYPEVWNRFKEYTKNQVLELCENYGKLDILWFDFSYDNMCEDTWKAEELIRMVRKHQPDVIIDNRLEGSGEKNGSIVTDHPNIYSGDFASPEMIIPPGGMKDLNGKPIPWELCATMNNHWGYCYYDHTYKTSQTIIRKLVECVSKGGNFILNVGPDAKGRIPKESQEILTQVGEWMEQNGESLYECGISEYDKPEWGRYTQKGNTVYAHIYETPLGALPLYGISPQEVGTITFLSSGAQVQRGEAWNTAMYSDTPFVALGENPVFSYPLPDEIDTVLKIELKK